MEPLAGRKTELFELLLLLELERAVEKLSSAQLTGSRVVADVRFTLTQAV